MDKLKLTDKEIELIEAIRNFQKTKHNYSFDLEFYVRELFESILTEKED
ncbi:MAG: ArsR family transcriptional regulator [Bacteroidales bacterium]|jgi:hypothetical protein|nr:ArsR family transcriptional regulator [Bacteroidales bacterium]